MSSTSNFEIDVLIEALWRILPRERTPIALHEPEFDEQDARYLLDCLESTFVSSAGPYVDLFEKRLCEFTGARQAVAVVNGTAALQTALRLAEVGEGDEVLIPTLTFVATANSASYCGATPHFIDSTECTLGLDPHKLSEYLSDIAELSNGEARNRLTGARLAAVVPMHTFGHPVEMEALLEVASRWRLQVVEDAAQALGSFRSGRHAGTFGKLGTLSFNGNKIITTGGGGAILTDDDTLADRARHLVTMAKRPHRWEYVHDAIGYNFRLPGLNAALGCAQLEGLPDQLERKRALAECFRQALAAIPAVRFVEEPNNAQSNYWLNALLLDERVSHLRNEVLDAINATGIMARPSWVLMHKLQMYSQCPRMDLTTAESLERRLVNVPSSSRWGAMA